MTSHRQIFRSSAIIGGASLINIFVGILKVKVLAILLGPAGVGLMGLYQSIMNTSATFAGCGLGNSGARQFATAQGDHKLIALTRYALSFASLILGLLGMLGLWLSREHLTRLVFENSLDVTEVGWLGIGVFLSIVAASQTSFLQGMRRIGDLAKINILGSISGFAVGILPVWWLGQQGVIWFVLAAPATSVAVSSWYTSRLPRAAGSLAWQAVVVQCRAMLKLGIPLMLSSLLTLASQLIVRTLIVHDFGLEPNGYFQAAWAVSMTYIGFVLGAMGSDYFPRLTEIIDDREHAIRLVNEQTEMALLLAGPVLLGMLTLSPIAIELLYAESFAPAAEILRWQVLGDILKVMGWPMGFIVLAQGRGDIFIATQLNWNLIYLLTVWLGLENLGLLSTGIGFFIAYLVQVGIVRLVVGKLIGFASSPNNLWLFLALFVSGMAIQATNIYAAHVSYIVGTALTLCISGYCFLRLSR